MTRWDEKSSESWALELEGDEWRGYFVYVAWGKTRRGRPLYVGKTRSLRQRVARHLLHAPWAAEVQSFTFYRFETIEDAADAERAAIAELNPRFNITRPRFYGHPITDGELRVDQQAIVARVQGRGRVA